MKHIVEYRTYRIYIAGAFIGNVTALSQTDAIAQAKRKFPVTIGVPVSARKV